MSTHWSLTPSVAAGTDRVAVRTGSYHDSIELMLIGRRISDRPGVTAAIASMATPLNLALLRDQGFVLDGDGAISPNDLIVAVRAQTPAAADAAMAELEAELASRRGARHETGDRAPAVSLRSLAARNPELSVAMISVPGTQAAYECAAALDAGLHVFCFSDGVDLGAELALKRRAAELDLLFMGPDCGTAIIDGVALGFANRVARGPVGIVSASGTGAQEVSCLLDAAGVGVSQIVGVGGRDLSGAIGGLMAGRALERLAGDPETEVLVLISKPPDPVVAAEMAARAGRLGKPVVLAFPGAGELSGLPAGVELETSLEAAAARAAVLAGATAPELEDGPVRPAADGWVRGLFSGGTLCVEAMAVAAERLGPISSNVALRPEWALADLDAPEGHAFIDFGADELTQGRAHPMIDPTLRMARFAREVADPRVSAIVLDVVLGHGAHADPAGVLAPTIAVATAARPELSVVVSVCGTAADPQGLERQTRELLDAGAIVTRSAARAGALAAAAVAVQGSVAGA